MPLCAVSPSISGPKISAIRFPCPHAPGIGLSLAHSLLSSGGIRLMVQGIFCCWSASSADVLSFKMQSVCIPEMHPAQPEEAAGLAARSIDTSLVGSSHPESWDPAGPNWSPLSPLPQAPHKPSTLNLKQLWQAVLGSPLALLCSTLLTCPGGTLTTFADVSPSLGLCWQLH